MQKIQTQTYEAYTALIALPEVTVFFFVYNFSLPLFAPIFIYILFSSSPPGLELGMWRVWVRRGGVYDLAGETGGKETTGET